MIFGSQATLLVRSIDRCGQGWKEPISARICLLSTQRGVKFMFLKDFSSVLLDLAF